MNAIAALRHSQLLTESTMTTQTTLANFSDTHLNTLYDAVALLDAAAERMDSAMPSATEDQMDTAQNTLRLVQMAGEKIRAVADLMFRAS